MSAKRGNSPPRTPPSAKRARTTSTPDTESTVADGSVIGSRMGSPSNESYRTSSASSARYSQQASQGMQTPSTVRGSLPTDAYIFGPKGVIGLVSKTTNSNMDSVSPLSTPGSTKKGGKKTRSTRRNNNRRYKRKHTISQRNCHFKHRIAFYSGKGYT